MDGTKYSMKEQTRNSSGSYRKVERKKSQQANYLAAHQGQTVSMISGVVNYQLDGYSKSGMDDHENGSLSYSASSTGESTDSSFADSLRMNEIYDPANLQLSAAAYEMLFKSKSSNGGIPSGRSFNRDSSFASDSLGYSTDGDSYCGYVDYSNVAMSRSGHMADINTLDHKAAISGTNGSNKAHAPLNGRPETTKKTSPSFSTTDRVQKNSAMSSHITRSSSNTSTRTPPNAFPLNSRNISSSSPATVVTSDVSLSSAGTPPPSYRKTDRDNRSNNARSKMREEYDEPRSIGNLSYAKWWMCGFTDAFNFNS